MFILNEIFVIAQKDGQREEEGWQKMSARRYIERPLISWDRRRNFKFLNKIKKGVN